ncbi:MAG: glutamine--tRNA ligase/YqeY domain fusion protein [Desulfonatronovibrionaceae bacterium]
MQETAKSNFIREIIEADLASGKHKTVVTRFPPEPNGYLHIGHAKAICLNFGIARDYGGRCHLRFDDTNPLKENPEFVQSIKDDVRWLGYEWDGEARFASDYFHNLYTFAVSLIEQGKAYVCSLTPEEIRSYRGTLTQPGRDSPYRDRSIEENLDLFTRMRKGKFRDGEHVLRARIDMSSPNMNMRDPVLYRILHAAHHRTGDKWCIYPTYDFTHCLSDALEGITHSLCSLEFQDHRPLYDWILKQLNVPCHPQQIEFARLNLNYTITSKRRLSRLVDEGYVEGWDDPRMPTISGLKRRGIPPAAVRDFCERIGVAKSDNIVDMALLEHCVREYLNQTAPRVMGVLDPLKVVITNYPHQTEDLEAVNNPEDPEMGSRKVPFSREIYIERDDFREDPPRKFFRLAPGREVRLRYAYFITCTGVIKDEEGEPVELRCTYDPESRGGQSPDGRKVKGTLHWVSAAHGLPAKVRLYDRLFKHPNPVGEGKNDTPFTEYINPESLQVKKGCVIEPGLAEKGPGYTCQFERKGYFRMDESSSRERPIFNRTATLRDSWAKIEKQLQQGKK